MATPNLDELHASLNAGDSEWFKRSFSSVVLKHKHGAWNAVGELASENEQAIEWLVEIMCKPESDTVRNVAFFSVLWAGPVAFRQLRKAWERGLDRGRIHLCMMDLAGAATGRPEQRERMEAAAQVEVPCWIECLKSDQWRLRLWAVMILPELVRFAPHHVEAVKLAILGATTDENETVRMCANQTLDNLAPKKA